MIIKAMHHVPFNHQYHVMNLAYMSVFLVSKKKKEIEQNTNSFPKYLILYMSC